MNQTLKEAILEVEALPEAEQEELAQALMDMAISKKIDAMLAESEALGGEVPENSPFAAMRKAIDAKLGAAEARGGAIPHDVVFARIKAKYGG